MNNAIEKQLKIKYNKKREQALAQAKANFSVAMKNKDFAQTFQNIRNLDLDIVKCTNENEKLNLKNKLKQLKQTLRNLTKKYGFEVEDFKPHFNCPKCQDTGFCNGIMCDCFKNQLISETLSQSGIKIDAKHTFDEYNENIASTEEQKQQMRKMKELFITYANKYPNVKNKNILLCGNTGVGKTFLLECLSNKLVNKNISVNFLSAFQMNSLFLNYHTTFDESKQQYLDCMLSPEVLIIDDLGTEPINKNVTIEYLYTIISERMNQEKATLISTNLFPNDILNRYGERIFSRLSFKTKSLIILLRGSDLRLKK